MRLPWLFLSLSLLFASRSLAQVAQPPSAASPAPALSPAPSTAESLTPAPSPTPTSPPAASPQPLEATGTPALTPAAADPTFPPRMVRAELAHLQVDRATPRRTVAGFLDAMRLSQRWLGAWYLDMRALPPDERAEGGLLASQLYRVIERTQWVTPEDLPDTASPAEGSRFVLFEFSRGGVKAPVAVEKVGNRWYFARDTVRQIPAMYDTLDDAWLRERLPKELFNRVLGLAWWQWGGMLLLLLLGVLVGRVAPRVFLRVLDRCLVQQGVPLPLAPLEKLGRPAAQTVEAILLFYGLQALLLPPTPEKALLFVLKLLILFAIVRLAYNGVGILESYLLRLAAQTPLRLDDQAVPLVARLTRIAVVIAGIIALLYQLNVDVASLLAGLGIGGLAVALAAKDTLANFFGSLNIFFDRPFQIGDYVLAGTLEGTIEEVGLRTTRIRTMNNSVIAIPNGELVTKAIENVSARKQIRIATVLRLIYTTTPEQVEAVIESARALLDESPLAAPEGRSVFLTGLGTEALEVTVQFHLASTDLTTFNRERQRIFLELLKRVRDAGTRLAVPARSIFLESGLPPEAADTLDKAPDQPAPSSLPANQPDSSPVPDDGGDTKPKQP